MASSEFSKRGLLGTWLRFPLKWIPLDAVCPILTGPARGLKWVVGSSTHGCWIGTYELAKQRMIASFVRQGDCVLDIGANAGFYSLLASRFVGSSGRVIAFEPLPENVRKIGRHLQLNGISNVSVVNAAVCDENGRAAFQVHASDECGGLDSTGSLEVETVSLDQMWQSGHLPSPRLVKIDVEGAEARVLAGAEMLIRNSRPVILLAGHGTTTQRTCEALLRDYGYTVTIDRDGWTDGMYESTAIPVADIPEGRSANRESVAVAASTTQTCSTHDRAPRVSVVMSVYNEGARVGRAIDGIRNQTWRDFELVIVDDGSSDDTPSILEKYQREDARIRVLRRENAGLTLALIHGCHSARGEYIARHDADDWSDPCRLERQVALLDSNHEFGIVACATRYVGPNDEPLDLIVRHNNPTEATRKLLDERQGPPAHGCVMFRRSIYESVGGYRPEFYFGQDSDLWLRICEQSLIAYDTRTMYFHRRDPFSISGRMATIQHEFGRWGQECRAARREHRAEDSILQEARKAAESLRGKKENNPAAHGQAKMAYHIGTSLAKQGDPRARQYFWQAIRSNPFYWRAWVRIALPRISR